MTDRSASFSRGDGSLMSSRRVVRTMENPFATVQKGGENSVKKTITARWVRRIGSDALYETDDYDDYY